MKFPILLLLAVISAYLISAFLTVSVNPEITFWAEAVRQREAAIEKIRTESPDQPIMFFTGGSSCAFSIDPAIIEKECGFPAINLGLPVSSGPRYILHQALRETKPGDILVVCLEPDLLTFPNQESSPSKTGFTLEARRGDLTSAAGGETFKRSVSISDYLTLSRPGAGYLITLAGRLTTGQGYRYKPNDIKYHGLVQTDSRDANLIPAGPSESTSLHPEGRRLLKEFQAAATAKGVTTAYSMPWYYIGTEALAKSRENKKMVLRSISEVMTVVEDGFSGAMDGEKNFADSGLHLTRRGMNLRTTALAQAITKNPNLRIGSR